MNISMRLCTNLLLAGIVACGACSLIVVSIFANKDVEGNLQSASVNVHAGPYQGSGMLILVPVEGRITTWVLTANHVVEALRHVDSDGVVTYGNVEVVQDIVIHNRIVAERQYDAKVVSVDRRRDIALLRVVSDGQFDTGVEFCLDTDIPQPGTGLFHCGAPGGKDTGGTCSLTDGIVSRIGVRIPEFGGREYGIYDQITCPALGGSSGGLVALANDGRVIGMLTIGLNGCDSFSWMVPVRSILDFARDIDAEWLFDHDLTPPRYDTLKMKNLFQLELSDETQSSSNSSMYYHPVTYDSYSGPC